MSPVDLSSFHSIVVSPTLRRRGADENKTNVERDRETSTQCTGDLEAQPWKRVRDIKDSAKRICLFGTVQPIEGERKEKKGRKKRHSAQQVNENHKGSRYWGYSISTIRQPISPYRLRSHPAYPSLQVIQRFRAERSWSRRNLPDPVRTNEMRRNFFVLQLQITGNLENLERCRRNG